MLPPSQHTGPVPVEDAKRPELPRGWTSATVETFSDVIGGGTPSTHKDEYWGGQIPWITSADIHGIRDIQPRKKITNNAIRASATNLLPTGSIIVVTRVGLGKVALLEEPLCFSQDSHGLIFNTDEIDGSYLTYYLSEAVKRFKYEGRGTTISGVTKRQLQELPVLLPPLAEQRRIVGEIEKQFTRLDAAVQALRAAQAKLKRYRASVLNAAVTGRLVPTEAAIARAEGCDYEHASVLLERIAREWAEQKQDKPRRKHPKPTPVDTSSLPELPEGWTWGTVSTVADIASGQTPKGIATSINASGEVPWYRVGDMNLVGNEIEMISSSSFISREDVHKLKLHIRPPGTIIFPKRGGAIGTNKKRRLATPATYDLNTMGIVPYLSCAQYIWWWFQTINLTVLGDGSNVPQINHDDVGPLPVPVPPVSEQRRIVMELERRVPTLDVTEVTIDTNLKRAERLRQAVLKRAFEGRLVPQDPDDEPAAVLLERIKTEKAAAEQKPRRGRQVASRRLL